MSSPIQALYATGNTLYAVIISPAGQFWNTSGTPAFENFNASHWGQYAVALTEYAGTGIYHGSYPAITGVLTTDIIYTQAGGSPAIGDVVASNLYQSQGVNVGAVGASWQSAQNMSYALGTQQLGTIVGTPSSATLLPTNLASTQLSAYAGRAIVMTSGTLIQQASFITGYDGAGNLTIQGFPSNGTPANNDTFIII